MSRPEIAIGNRVFSEGKSPYIIAEIGVNHEGSKEKAFELIDLAAEGGAHAAKFQTYKASKLAAKQSPAYWDVTKEPTKSQFELFQKFDSFESQDYKDLANYCKEVGVDFVSTPFDADAVELLDCLVPVFKIASADITNIPLLRQVGASGKPVILSTGAAKLWEIDNALTELSKVGANSVALLHCMLNYPTAYADAGLKMIESLKRNFPDNVIGYSDHTLPESDMMTVIAATTLGASIIEKHFTHDKTLPGNDHYHAMDVNDLKVLVKNFERLQLLLGDIDEAGREKELAAREHARRSIVLNQTLPSGHVICEADITYKRPASGVSTLFWDQVIGATLLRDLEADAILQWEDIRTLRSAL